MGRGVRSRLNDVMPLPRGVSAGATAGSLSPSKKTAIEGWPERAGRADAGSAQGSSQKGVYLIMKLKLPLLDLWLVTGRRLRAGYADRYQRGYEKGWAARSAEASGEGTEVDGHSWTVPAEDEPPATQPPA